MKDKHISLMLLLYLWSTLLFSQGTISLNTPRTAGGTLTACQQISLTSGFTFKATSTGSLTLRVNPSTCDPYAGAASSVSTNQNYIQTKTYTTDTGTRYKESIQYFDGLGRPMQVVQRGVTPNTADLVAYQEYDLFGREDRSWLPAVSAGNNGAFMALSSFKTSSNSTYYSTSHNAVKDSVAYSKPVYEASPLNRILEQHGPGSGWKGKAIKTENLTNSGTSGQLSCALFVVDGSGTATKVKKTGFYANNELYVTKITDEDTNISYEFKDKLGQVVLTRQILNTANLDTYYVYDDFGNLCFVLPPMASEVLIQYNNSWDETNSTPIKQYGYLYKYDTRNRCIRKRLPGCEPIYYVYDKADRLIFTQDGEQRKKGIWLGTFYDALGRMVLNGQFTNAHNKTIGSGVFDSHLIKAEYTGVAPNGSDKLYLYSLTIDGSPLVTTGSALYTVNYYDNYDFLGKINIPNYTYDSSKESLGYGKAYGTHSTDKSMSKGHLTCTITRQLDISLTPNLLYSVFYYDNKKRLIQSRSSNHLNGVEREYFAYNFTGQPIKKMHVHSATGKASQSEVYAYAYDHAGRLVKETHQLNSGTTVTLAANTYDELGRLKTNQKHTHANLKTSYGYNIRSWTKTISSPMFSQALYYNESYGGSKPQYNGNISAMSWKVYDESGQPGYAYSYDNLSRLTAATYLANGVVYPSGYGMENITYDKHGNMRTMKLHGGSIGVVDNLTMTYTGNQLTKADDGIATISHNESMDFKDYSKVATEYTYNANGAMASDLNKGITGIQYNFLNLPQAIEIASPSVKGRVKYTYSAGGVKLRTVHETDMNVQNATIMAVAPFATETTDIRTTDYVGNKVYENGALKRILVDGGYIEGTTYHFYQSDHLGNNRIVAKSDGTQVQKTHYYPFGSSFAVTSGANAQPYKYNGKELDQMHGLNLYDYSARYYESAIGRFTSVDPLAENEYNWSPYAYVDNNPIKYVDIDGMKKGDPDDPYELLEVVVTPPTEIGNQVLPQESSLWNLWYILTGPRQYTEYSTSESNYGLVKNFNVYASGKAYSVVNPMAPITGTPPIPSRSGALVATKIIKVVFSTKKNGQLLKIAKETFKSNPRISKEASNLLNQFSKGNLNPGIGTHDIGKGIYELRGAEGARVYFKYVDEGIEVLGYSSKTNQAQVINVLLNTY